MVRMENHECAPRTKPATTAAINARAEAARQRLSGREIARRLDISSIYVSRRLSGEVEFSETDLRNFAAVLSIPAASLLDEASK